MAVNVKYTTYLQMYRLRQLSSLGRTHILIKHSKSRGKDNNKKNKKKHERSESYRMLT